MGKSIIIALLIASCLPLLAQNQRQSDSLRKALPNIKSDTGRIGALIKIEEYYFFKGDLDSANIFLEQANRLNKKSADPKLQNKINIHSAQNYCVKYPDYDPKKLFLPLIAYSHKTNDKPNERTAWLYLAQSIGPNVKSYEFILSCLQHAVLLSRQLNDEISELRIQRDMADIHMQQIKFDLAERELLGILQNFKRAGSENLLYTHDLLAALYCRKGDFNKGLLHSLKTVQIMKSTGDSVAAMTFYNRRAYIYRTLGKLSLSIEWSKKTLYQMSIAKGHDYMFMIINQIAVDMIHERRAKEALQFVLNEKAKYKPANLAEERNLQKALGSCYSALKKYDLAEKYYLKMITGGNQQKNNFSYDEQAGSNATIASFYLKIGNYKAAKKHLIEAHKYYQLNGSLPPIKDIQLSLFKADSALGNYRSAMGYLQESSKLKDSIFTVAKNKQIEELQIQYQTAEKEKDLELKQIALERTRNTQNWTIAGSGLLLIIASLLYRQSGMRKKNNKTITRKNDQLQHLLTEKEWLLKEVHHRVKNNLHTIICLLESQARYLENDALEAIENSQHRIYAMSLIHQKLYQSDDIKTIDMATYITELVKSLEESFGSGNNIQFHLKIDSVNLTISQAIPVGLIINEAVTNSIKYAFPDNRKGRISISMTKGADQITLELADNGIGMPQIDSDTEPASLGLRLMKGLSEDIDADIDFEVDNGTRITVLFKPDALNEVESFLNSPASKAAYV